MNEVADGVEETMSCGESVEESRLATVAALFAVLAHQGRLRLLVALGGDELSVNHLADILDLSPDEVQKHLAVLRSVGAVSSRVLSGRSFYRSSDPTTLALILRHLNRREPAAALQSTASAPTAASTARATCAS